jgi:hypothetical protein
MNMDKLPQLVLKPDQSRMDPPYFNVCRVMEDGTLKIMMSGTDNIQAMLAFIDGFSEAWNEWEEWSNEH